MNPLYLSGGLIALVLFFYRVSTAAHPLYLVGGLIALVLGLYLLIALFKAEEW